MRMKFQVTPLLISLIKALMITGKDVLKEKMAFSFPDDLNLIIQEVNMDQFFSPLYPIQDSVLPSFHPKLEDVHMAKLLPSVNSYLSLAFPPSLITCPP